MRGNFTKKQFSLNSKFKKPGPKGEMLASNYLSSKAVKEEKWL